MENAGRKGRFYVDSSCLMFNNDDNMESTPDLNKATLNIEEGYQQMVDAAEALFPGISAQMATYTNNKADLESFQAYLDLINETPTVVTANSAM